MEEKQIFSTQDYSRDSFRLYYLWKNFSLMIIFSKSKRLTPNIIPKNPPTSATKTKTRTTK